MVEVTTYLGKPITYMTRQELIKCIEFLAPYINKYHESEHKRAQTTAEFFREMGKRK